MMIEAGPGNYPDRTLPQLLEDRAGMTADAVAYRIKDRGLWKPTTWSEYRDQVEHFALGLVDRGMEPGSTVAILGDNWPHHLVADLAAQALGGSGVVLFPESTSDEVAYVLAHAECRVVVVRDQEQADKVLDVIDELPDVGFIVYCDGRGMQRYRSQRVLSFDKMIDAGRARAAANPGEYQNFVDEGRSHDPAMIMYTSGTTGRPKGAMMSHHNVVAAIVNFFAVEPLQFGDERLVFLPLAWAGERYFSTAGHLLVGYRLNFAESPETLRADIREIGPQQLVGAPRMWEDFLSSFELRMGEATRLKRAIYRWGMDVGQSLVDFDLAGEALPLRLRLKRKVAEFLVYRPVRDQLGLLRATRVYSGGGALGQEVAKYFLSLGVPIKQMYGQTEAGITTTHWDKIKPETMGQPIPGVEVVINENNEIAHRGPSVFLGYLKNPDATEEVLRDGLLLSGDEGFLDDDGHLVVVDRSKNVATLMSGDRFSPTFVENKAKFSRFIREAVCFGHERPFPVLLVNIDGDVVGRWAEKNRVGYTTYTDLSQKPQIIDLIREEIVRINDSLPERLRVGRFVILHKEFDADDEEITRTKKIRRNLVEQRYSFILDALYAGEDSIEVEAKVTYRDGRSSVITTRLNLMDASKEAVVSHG
ncbi:AMP-dependent synthetase/ligase [Aeromicrobium piscarium]|uniref:Acyl-CoA synthetase n=1 Tax=Aeromicrobium piscarium TaxID=2590901 RepID=A0A554S7U1_9ACTN|nr:AMP-binding protein [Aeromicrobium piscarium]TSD62386.1 long-chain fatty acid--CoA ligase [Aeromicrobium piscarium]